MAAGMLGTLVAFWKEWGILSMVLMSFVMQVTLLITAEIRRRKDSHLLKVIVWLAYVLNDMTATYALGHMTVIIVTSHQHQLVAFWAPLLMLHLGGQDNITAYAIEDNRLWLRHLQTLVIQAVASAYIIYQSSILTGHIMLSSAVILMFLVGIVKYGEKVCALCFASSSNLLGKNYQSFMEVPVSSSTNILILDHGKKLQALEALPMSLLDYAKHLLKEPLPFLPLNMSRTFNWEDMYGVAEVQLWLMYDVFYSKAKLIHSFRRYCIRAISLLGTVAALVLFCMLIEKDGYRRSDVFTTYVLLAGALVLETTSMLRAMFSIWTYTNVLTAASPMAKVWARRSRLKSFVLGTLGRLAWSLFKFRAYVLAKYATPRARRRATTGYWAGSMGQHNLFYICNNSKDSRCSRIARWMGHEDSWNMLVYTSSVPVSPYISELLEEQLKASIGVDFESLDHIHKSRGRAVLKRMPGLQEELGWLMHMELDQSILVWHIATSVYLAWYEAQRAGSPHHAASTHVTMALSSYMMFLLADRPYLLPDNASRQRVHPSLRSAQV